MLLRRLTLLISCGVILCGSAVVSHGAEGNFLSTLSPAEKSAAGLDKLSANQRATLDNLIEREALLAKEGNVPAFNGEFSQRRSAPELAKAGIDHLNTEQRAYLNVLVARSISRSTPPAQSFATMSHGSEITVGVKPVLPRLETHGEVSFTAGTAGGGRNFYGGSFEVEEVDPVHGLSVSIGYSELHGKGFIPWYDRPGRQWW